MSLKILKNILTNNDCYRSGRTINPIGMQLHTIGTGQNTASSLASYWNQGGIEACVHYCVDAEQEDLVLQFLPDNYRSWADAGFGNGNAITVELMESDYMRYTGGASYTVTDEAKFKADVTRAYNTAVKFFAQKCKEYGWDPQEKLGNGLHRVFSHDEGRRLGLSSGHVDPTHIWDRYGWTMDQFRADVKKAMGEKLVEVTSTEEVQWYRVRKTWKNAESQIGAYQELKNAKDNCPPGYKVYDYKGKVVYKNTAKAEPEPVKEETVVKPEGTQWTDFKGLSEKEAAEKILELAKADYEKSGIFASVTAAQMILESGYVTTELSKANNVFGMKTNLSNNGWEGSTWDGVSKVTILTKEEYTPEVITEISADFRKYPKIEDSVGDHSAYLLGAKNGSKRRYEGLTAASDYRSAITIIKNGGYATDSKYVNKICSIIERYNLNRYDKKPETPAVEAPAKEPSNTGLRYRVQCGSYSDINNARRMASMMQEKGFESLVQNFGTYIAQAGVFSNIENANALAVKISKAGLPVAVIKMS